MVSSEHTALRHGDQQHRRVRNKGVVLRRWRIDMLAGLRAL
jgi:hypothetical protein